MLALIIAVYVLDSIPNALTYMFRPDSHSTYETIFLLCPNNFKSKEVADIPNQSHIPAQNNLMEDQSDCDSFWLCSFLTSTTGKQYLALQHILGSADCSSICKSSLLYLETKIN